MRASLFSWCHSERRAAWCWRGGLQLLPSLLSLGLMSCWCPPPASPHSMCLPRLMCGHGSDGRNWAVVRGASASSHAAPCMRLRVGDSSATSCDAHAEEQEYLQRLILHAIRLVLRSAGRETPAAARLVILRTVQSPLSVIVEPSVSKQTPFS